MRRGEVVRQLARDNLEVNDAWLCDKGRFAFRFPRRAGPDHDAARSAIAGWSRRRSARSLTDIAEWCAGTRVRVPHRRTADGRGLLRAVEARAHGLRHERPRPPARRRRLARRGEWSPRVAPRQSVTYDDVERAKVILVAGLDAEQEVPILHLRPAQGRRGAARRSSCCIRGARGCATWRSTSCAGPGERAGRRPPAAAGHRRGAPRGGSRRRDASPVRGWRTAEPGAGTSRELRAARPARGSRTSRAARTIAARSVAGVHPSLCPGAGGSASPTSARRSRTLWGPIIVGDEGRNWWGILEACAERDIDVLFLIGVDPLRDFPTPRSRTRALQNVRSRGRPVARARHRWSRSRTRSCRRRRSWRRTGTSRRGRGAASGSGRCAARPGIALPDWEIFASLALAAGGDLGSRRSTSSTRRWAGCWRRAIDRSGRHAGERARPARRSPRARSHLFTYPLLVDEGRLVRTLGRAEGRRWRTSRSWRSTRTTRRRAA